MAEWLSTALLRPGGGCNRPGSLNGSVCPVFTVEVYWALVLRVVAAFRVRHAPVCLRRKPAGSRRSSDAQHHAVSRVPKHPLVCSGCTWWRMSLQALTMRVPKSKLEISGRVGGGKWLKFRFGCAWVTERSRNDWVSRESHLKITESGRPESHLKFIGTGVRARRLQKYFDSRAGRATVSKNLSGGPWEINPLHEKMQARGLMPLELEMCRLTASRVYIVGHNTRSWCTSATWTHRCIQWTCWRSCEVGYFTYCTYIACFVELTFLS